MGITHRQLLLQAVVEVLGLVRLELFQGDASLADEFIVPEFVLVTHGNPVKALTTGTRLNAAITLFRATGRRKEEKVQHIACKHCN